MESFVSLCFFIFMLLFLKKTIDSMLFCDNMKIDKLMNATYPKQKNKMKTYLNINDCELRSLGDILELNEREERDVLGRTPQERLHSRDIPDYPHEEL